MQCVASGHLPEEAIGPSIRGCALRVGVRLEHECEGEVHADVQVVHIERRVAHDISIGVDGAGECADDAPGSALRRPADIRPVVVHPCPGAGCRLDPVDDQHGAIRQAAAAAVDAFAEWRRAEKLRLVLLPEELKLLG
eukprot:6316005-Prymnesium_polylepis.2